MFQEILLLMMQNIVGRIASVCPKCKSSNIRRLRRVSGYLAEVDRFVKGKKLELLDRLNHDR